MERKHGFQLMHPSGNPSNRKTFVEFLADNSVQADCHSFHFYIRSAFNVHISIFKQILQKMANREKETFFISKTGHKSQKCVGLGLQMYGWMHGLYIASVSVAVMFEFKW